MGKTPYYLPFSVVLIAHLNILRLALLLPPVQNVPTFPSSTGTLHTCAGTAVLVQQMTVQRHVSNQGKQNGSTGNVLDLLMANESSSAVQTKQKTALYQKPHSLYKQNSISFSEEGTNSIMCWYIRNVMYFNSLVF